MATVSDFGSVEVKRLRIDEEIAAVRYGTEIMDKDLVFKAGDVTHPNQAIRFAVHDGEAYTDAFSIDANGFAISDLKMSGASTGVSGMDADVKLGEMRVEHFDDHANQRAGEINFLLNIGDTDTQTIDIMSLTPEQIALNTATTVSGTLSCSSHVTSKTITATGSAARNTIATFQHPLSDTAVLVERNEDGMVQLNGPIQSSSIVTASLSCSSLATESLVMNTCSIAQLLSLDTCTIKAVNNNLILRPGRSASVVADSDCTINGHLQVDSLSTGFLDTTCIRQTTPLSVSNARIGQLVCDAATTETLTCSSINTNNAYPLEFSTNTLMLAEEPVRFEDGSLSLSYCLLTKDVLRSGGLSCANGLLTCDSATFDDVNTENCTSNDIQTTTATVAASLSAATIKTSILLASKSVQAPTASVDRLYSSKIVVSTSEINEEGLICPTISSQSGTVNAISSNTITASALSVSSALVSDSIECAVINTQACSIAHCTSDVLATKELESTTVNIGAVSSPFTTRLKTLDDKTLHFSNGIDVPSASMERLDVGTINLQTTNPQGGPPIAISWDATKLQVPADMHAQSFECSRASITDFIQTPVVETQLIAGRDGKLQLATGGYDTTTLALTNGSFFLGKEADSGSGDAFCTINCPTARSALALQQNDTTFAFNLESTITGLQSNRPVFLSCSNFITHQIQCDVLSTPSASLGRITPPTRNLEIAGKCTLDAISTGSITTTSLAANATSTATLTANALSANSCTTSELRIASSEGAASTIRSSATHLTTNASRLTISPDNEDVCGFEMVTRTGKSLSIKLDSYETQITGPAIRFETPLTTTSNLSTSTVDAQSIECASCSVGVLQATNGSVEDLTCNEITTNQSLTIGIDSVARFTSNGIAADELLLDAQTITTHAKTIIGSPAATTSTAAPQLHVHAPAATSGRPAIAVSGESEAVIELETKDIAAQTRTINFVRDAQKWMIGVPNFPDDDVDIFGLYYNDNAFLTVNPQTQSLDVPQNASFANLSVAAITMAEVRVQDCVFEASDRILTLDCDNFEIQTRDTNGLPIALLSISQAAITVTPPMTLSGGLNLGNNRCVQVATPIEDTDASNRAYVDQKFDELFTSERVFNAPIFFENPTDATTAAAFSLGLGTSSLELQTGTNANHSLRITSGHTNTTTAEFFASDQVVVYSPIELREPITLPNHTITSSATSLDLSPTTSTSTAMRLSGLNLGIAPLNTSTQPAHPLHLIGSGVDDLAAFEGDALRSRINVSTSDANGQSMITYSASANAFASGYNASADAFVIASSTDLAQNTHLVIGRDSGLIQTSDNLKINRVNGSLSIEEQGITTFNANKSNISCENFAISFDATQGSVEHTVGDNTILNLSSLGASITGSIFMSNDLHIGNIILSQTEFGDLNCNTKFSAPNIETNTISLSDRVGFNLFDDTNEVVRFRDDGFGFLLDFDKTTGELDFSLPTSSNAFGRGHLFASDTPILCLQPDAVGIGMRPTTTDAARLNISAESGAHLSIINPSAGGSSASVTLNDAGELQFDATQQNYSFNGEVTAHTHYASNFIYLGPEKEWRINVSATGSLVFESKTASGGYELRQSFEA